MSDQNGKSYQRGLGGLGGPGDAADQNETFSKFANMFKDQYEQYVAKQHKPGILIAGASGTGKSTLCNLMLGREFASVGTGRPVTRGINCYADDKVTIFDSEGYEPGSATESEYLKLISDFVSAREHEEVPVDVIWYAISAPGARVTDLDASLIKTLKNDLHKPVAAVLTQVDVATLEQCDALREALLKTAGLEELAVFESTHAADIAIARARSLDALFDWTVTHLEQSRRDSFIAACHQRGFDLKEKEASTIIKEHVGLAVAACATPVPFSDALLLSPIQLAMLARIAFVWDLTGIKELAGGLLVNSIMPTLGRSIAGNLLKLIPGIGTLAGTVINGGVAAALTTALGTVFNKTCRKIAEGKLTGRAQDLSDLFDSDFVKNVIELFKLHNRKNS